jgi:hypothetical protein
MTPGAPWDSAQVQSLNLRPGQPWQIFMPLAWR